MCLCADVQVLLMTDILVFLQEKDQRYIFSCLVSQAHGPQTLTQAPYLDPLTLNLSALPLYLVLVLFDPGQTCRAVPSEPDCAGYSQSGARDLPDY